VVAAMSADAVTREELLPVNAERIERRLNEIWRDMGTEPVSGELPVKLCLATCVLVADDVSRAIAERLAGELAHLHPSRIISICLSEGSGSYGAEVSTLCTRDPQTHQVRCWEIIKIEADRVRTRDLTGAVRALVVESVPVVTVDFRRSLDSPSLDQALAQMTEYAFVDASVVSAGPEERAALPLRWYRTLPVRNLVSDLFALTSAATPESFVVRDDREERSFSDLLYGWLLYRLRAKGEMTITPQGMELRMAGAAVSVRHEAAHLGSGVVMRVRFTDGDEATVYRSGLTDDAEVEYRVVYGRQVVSRRLAEFPLSKYVILSLQDDSEFDEYAAVCRVMREYQLGDGVQQA
jgi:hypothetical protein